MGPQFARWYNLSPPRWSFIAPPLTACDQENSVGAPLQAVQTHGRWKSPQMPARYTRGEKALEWL